MNTFPDEFIELFSRSTRAQFERSVSAGRDRGSRNKTCFWRTANVMAGQHANARITLLEHSMLPLLRPFRAEISPDSIWSMTESYTEALEKTARCKTADLTQLRSRAYRQAKQIGLVKMLNSESAKWVAESMSGQSLSDERDLQIVCYEHGDYNGPHNDHHPDVEGAERGFVDLHLSFSNQFVAHQWLVYEKAGFLSEILNVGDRSSIACYRLPFWHYTTPLQARSGKQQVARRWVLMASFDIE